MGKTSKGKRKHRRELLSKIHPQQAKASSPDPSNLQRLPISYQEINDYYQSSPESRPFDLRKETFLRIEAITGRPLICYVAKTANVAPHLPTAIDDSDLIGFTDLVHSVAGNDVDVLIESVSPSPLLLLSFYFRDEFFPTRPTRVHRSGLAGRFLVVH